MLVTRGVGELTYDLKATPTPSVVIIVKAQVDPPPDTYEQGVRVVIVDIVRNHPGSVNPMIKSNNLMNSALAMQEAFRQRRVRGRDAQLSRRARRVHHLEPVRDQERRGADAAARRRPAPRDHAGVRLRNRRRARASRSREAVLQDDDLLGADEAFLTSTTREIVPIVSVGDRRIGSGTPGAVTRALMEAFRRKAQELLTDSNRLAR